ncbi:MAG: hypothetical protein NC548_30560 [Lachnospiraceae bacterium]|nr:hypothetical protein [Lachnospiraceae bacterium]
MKRLKLNFWIQKNRRIFFGICFLVVLSIVLLAFRRVNINVDTNNSAIIGVVGTLLGAVIGGFLSLMGSLWINSKQQRATQNIKKKNVIYSPLYDELVDIHNRILVSNPFPNYIVFEKGDQTILPHPQFTAWERIKSDTRYLEVPDILMKQMEQLENAIHNYQDIRGKGNEVVQRIFNEVLQENGLNKCLITNIGEVISSGILNNEKVDIYHMAMEIASPNQLADSIKRKVNEQTYEKCNSDEMVLEIRKRYDVWIKVQSDAIEMLSILIKQVLLKYEG